jgi:hypothetical protein
VQFKGPKDALKEREGSPSSDVVVKGTSASLIVERTTKSETGKEKVKTLKTSRSVEPLVAKATDRRLLRSQPNESTVSLANTSLPKRKEKGSNNGGLESEQVKSNGPHHSHFDVDEPSTSSTPINSTSVVYAPRPRLHSSMPSSPLNQKAPQPRRSAPTPPPKRRKPPAVPALHRNGNVLGGGVTMTTIKSSAGKG